MDLWETIYERRSVRKFKDLEIEHDKILKILDAARWAPSACNEQLWRFIVIRNKEKKEKLVSEAGAISLIKKAPVVIACYYYNDVEIRFVPAIESISAAIQNMLLAAKSLGLGAVWVSSVGKRETVNKVLSVPKNYYLASYVLMGYPEYIPPPPPRRPFKEIIHFEDFKKQEKGIKVTHNPSKWSVRDIAQYQKYVSRKTSFGEELDIYNTLEKDLLRKVIKKELIDTCVGIDFFSYDGSLIDCFPSDMQIVSLELSSQTAQYVKRSDSILPIVFDGYRLPIMSNSISGATIFFKLERFPPKYWPKLFKEIYRILKPNGKLVITYRNSKSLYGLFYKLILLFFGDNIRKSGLYVFFGPYKPISGGIDILLRHHGFKTKTTKYHFIPQVFEDYSRMFLKYLKSGGTAYAKVEHKNIISSIIRIICRHEGFKFLGSITVISAEKSN